MDGRMDTIEIQCLSCGSMNEIVCDPQDLQNWRDGKGYIQDLLHYLSDADRELLISGTCDDCFTSMFGSEEEEEEGLLDLSLAEQNVMAEFCSIISSFLIDNDSIDDSYAELGEKIRLAAEGHSPQFFGLLYEKFHRSGKNR